MCLVLHILVYIQALPEFGFEDVTDNDPHPSVSISIS